jgi:PAS domain S-box-containing protein
MEKPRFSSDLFLDIIEGIPQAVTITAAETRTIIYANPAACAMFGYTTKSEFEGRTLVDIHPFDVAVIVSKLLNDRTIGPFTSAPKIACLRKNGTSFLAEVSGVRMVIDGAYCWVGFFNECGKQLDREGVIEVDDVLRDHREIASKVFDTSPGAIAISRISDGIYLDVNPAFTEQTGYSRDEVVGRRSGDLGLWTMLEDRQRLLRDLEQNHGTTWIETRFRHKDGHLFFGIVYARSMVLNEPYLLTITNNISGIKQAQQALFAEKERRAVTLHSIGHAVITTDTDGRVRLMNKVAEQLTGWSQDESLGQPLAIVFNTVDEATGARCESPVARVLATGAATELGSSIVLVARDGTRRPIADSGAPIRDATGSILGTVLVFRDTTESRKAQTLLRQSEEKFRTIIEQNADGFALLDEFGTVIEWNPALERISGITGEQAMGKPVWELLQFVQASMAEHAHGAERLRELFSGGLSRSDSPVFFHNREFVTQREGEEITLEQTAFPVKTERGFRVGCIIRDITQQKKASMALQKAEKLESVGVLAGGIAHDFNNLLGGIFGNIELASIKARDPEILSHLHASMQTMDRARALTQQLLTFAKGGAPVRRAGSLFPFVRTAVEFALSGSNVSCRFKVEPSLWICNFDKNQMGQVVDNIVLNAVQAMPQGGCITVLAENVVVGEYESPSLSPGKYVRTSFADQGPGIPPSISARIFDPFFTTKAKGTGLGLATCYSIMKQHAGFIAVESELGRGSVFHTWLPASEEPLLEQSAANKQSSRGQGTILVMDDEPMIREVAVKLLEHIGYSCRTAQEGHEALNEYQRFLGEGGRWRAVICDLTVRGGMSGKDLASRIRQIDKEVPIIVSSGYADDPVLADPKRYGFDDSIPKPYTFSQLSQVLDRNAPKQPRTC